MLILPDDIHTMIDLETLDLNPTAAVIQIGACAFNIMDGILDTFQTTIDLSEAMKHGTVDGNTLRFWMEQSDAARTSTMNGTRSSIASVRDYQNWLDCLNLSIGNHADHHWSHATFDFPVITNLCNNIGVNDPHYYRKTRDLRTLKVFAGEVDTTGIDKGVAHTGRDDAIYQAKIAIKQIRKLIL